MDVLGKILGHLGAFRNIQKAFADRLRSHLLRGDFDKAVVIGERLLDMKPNSEVLEFMTYPFENRGGKSMPAVLMGDLLAKLKARPSEDHLQPWATLWRMHLLDRMHREEEAFQESAKLAGVAERYAWMRFHHGVMLLRVRFDYEAAENEFAAVLKGAPNAWQAAALSAEAALCRGQADRAFRTMDALVAGLPVIARRMALAWRGEMRLWRGEFDAAIRDLDSASEMTTLILCWRGAALLQAGRVEEGLADLDAHLQKEPEDREALVWRGEALRKLGRTTEALRDLDAAVRLGGPPLWALINRALARAASGDAAGMWSDFHAIPAEVILHFEWKRRACVEEDRRPELAVELLEAMLKSGGGIRRNDAYLYPLWMERP